MTNTRDMDREALIENTAKAMHEAGHKAGFFNYGWNRVQPHGVQKYMVLAEAALNLIAPVAEKMRDALKSIESDAIALGGNYELTHQYPEKAGEIDWIARHAMDGLEGGTVAGVGAHTPGRVDTSAPNLDDAVKSIAEALPDTWRHEPFMEICNIAACAALTTERARLPQDEWQPLATIPRNGAQVYLLGVGQKIDIGEWYNAEGHPLEDQINSVHGFGPHTHWKPIQSASLLPVLEMARDAAEAIVNQFERGPYVGEPSKSPLHKTKQAITAINEVLGKE